MKRFFPFLAIMLCFALLAGCSRKPSAPQQPSPPAPSVEETTLPSVPETEVPVIPDVPQTEAPTAAPTEPHIPPTEAPTEPEIPETQQPSPVQTSDHDAKIQQIRDWYQAIVYDPELETVTLSAAATVYLKGYDVVSIAEYRQLDDSLEPALATVHYYYHYDVPFFIFIEYENAQYEEVRLYFDNGELIRWIVDDNAPQDNVPNAEWQRYYIDAFAAQESAWIALE